MTVWRLVWRTLVHDRRSLSGTLMGATLAAMVLVGALIIGDSVRHTLRRQAEVRIGAVDDAMSTGDRLVRIALADALDAAQPDTSFASVLQLQGIASTPDRERRALNVSLMGVDSRFFALAPDSDFDPDLQPGEALVNTRLAQQLSISEGDTFIMRVNRPSALSRDLTFATTDDAVLALRLRVASVVTDAQFGHFSLSADQIPPFNVFVPLTWLGENAAQAGRANLVLANEAKASSSPKGGFAPPIPSHWTIEDLGLSTRPSAADDSVEWRSSRVFLDEAVATALAAQHPDAVGVLTYFVNEIRHGDRATPYSTIAGVGALASQLAADSPWRDVVPGDLGDDEIVITDWLAADLHVVAGDRLTIRYFVLGAGRKLTEQSAEFTVRRIVPLAAPARDPTLMPDLPGLSDSANCRDWNPGIPVNLDRIRDQDESYWDEHRGTPKAFINLSRAQELWANRFGNLTAVRIPAADSSSTDADQLLAQLDPRAFGLVFQPVRSAALAAANPTTDFGGLFLGLSVFLIGSAVLLTGMLFAFTVHQRRRQIGTLLAMGWSEWSVRGWLGREAACLAAVGCLLGAPLAIAYSAGVLAALSTIWRGAVASAPLTLHITPWSLAIGSVASFLVAMIAMHFAVRSLLHRQAIELLASETGTSDANQSGATRRRLVLPLLITLLLLGGTASIVWGAVSEQGQAIAAFFASGALLLGAGILASRWLLARLLEHQADRILTLSNLGLRSAARRPGRSTAAMALLACGCFLVVAVGMNRLPTPRAGDRQSGTGGFALVGQSSIPLLADLNSTETRESLNFDEQLFADVSVVPLRVRPGDEASCLNLNRAQQPRILGVDPAALASRDAFRFAATLDAPAEVNPWMLLEDADRSDAIVPAIVDQASMMWAMHRRLGDVIEYQDDAGRTIGLRLVGALSNSILQGSLIISESAFEQYFPSQAGHSMLLIDAPPDRLDAVATSLSRSLADIGLELVPTAQRLAEFNAVQNTYMAVFQVLGGLGLIVGTAGLGMVLVRNVSERRGELGLLIAIGFTRRHVRKVLLIEHLLLLLGGLGCGVGAAIPAVWPALSQSASTASIAVTLIIVALIAASGLLWVAVATRWATRGRLIDSLRYE